MGRQCEVHCCFVGQSSIAESYLSTLFVSPSQAFRGMSLRTCLRIGEYIHEIPTCIPTYIGTCKLGRSHWVYASKMRMNRGLQQKLPAQISAQASLITGNAEMKQITGIYQVIIRVSIFNTNIMQVMQSIYLALI